MATSGTTSYNLDVAKIIETAARRVRPNSLGPLSAQDARNARNCLNMVLTDISNAGHAMSNLEYRTLSVSQGVASYSVSSNVIDVLDVVFSEFDSATSSYSDSGIDRISISEYNQINDKTTQSKPSQFALHRGAAQATLYLYPTPTTNVDLLRFWAFTRIEDITAANQDVDLSYRYSNALLAGTAYYLALETEGVSEEKINRLKLNYVEALELAFSEDRERASIYITPSI